MTNEKDTPQETDLSPETGLPSTEPIWRPEDVPLLRAARALNDMMPEPFRDRTVDDIARDLSTRLFDPETRDIDAAITMQARLLDILFSSSVSNGMTAGHYDLQRLHLALKMQRQCSATIDAYHRTRAQRQTSERAKSQKAANEMKDPLL